MEQKSNFHVGDRVIVQGLGEPVGTNGFVTELVEIRYTLTPSAVRGITYWPKVMLDNRVHAVFHPSVVRIATGATGATG